MKYAVPQESLLDTIKRDYPQLDLELISSAYEYARVHHEGQVRESGEPYFEHPVAVARIMLSLGMDSPTIAAGLLHDLVEDTDVTTDDLREHFGPEVADMVEGVTHLTRINYDSREEYQAESIRKMIVAMSKDIRVVIIKLADRLHNMRTLGVRSKDAQQRVARQTMDIFAPLASRLGIYNMKWELEDLSFQYLEPEKYHELVSLISMRRQEREAIISDLCQQVRNCLKDEPIQNLVIDGRPKHLYSIYKKMQNNTPFEQIYDLLAIRVIVDTIPECYAVLGDIHSHWMPMPGRFKDYIAMPKPNQYQSLHTTVVSSFGQAFEVQIRTHEMHRTAEYGIAAHWKYKENRTDTTDLDSKLQWLRNVMEWSNETSDSMEFIDTLKVDLYADRVFVFSPKGQVFDLPKGANAIDFAYRIHSGVGNKCIGAKINGRMTQLATPLQTGDIVEIITSNAAKGPSRDWMDIAQTPQARSKIRAWFKKEQREENIERGKTMLAASVQRYGVSWNQLMRPEWIDLVLKRHSLSSIDDLYNAVGYGGITSARVTARLMEEYRAEKARIQQEQALQQDRPENVKPLVTSVSNGVIVKGEANMLVRFAHCCNPVPGDSIVGFITRGRGVSVHRADCSNLNDTNFELDRFIEVEWAGESSSSYQAELELQMQDRPGLLADVSMAAMNLNVKMLSLNAKAMGPVAEISLGVEIRNKDQLEALIRQFNKMPETIHVFRKGRG